jgi:hypothetical protein
MVAMSLPKAVAENDNAKQLPFSWKLQVAILVQASFLMPHGQGLPSPPDAGSLRVRQSIFAAYHFGAIQERS